MRLGGGVFTDQTFLPLDVSSQSFVEQLCTSSNDILVSITVMSLRPAQALHERYSVYLGISIVGSVGR